MSLLVGTAGVPVSSKKRSTESGIERIRELGLDCMEIEFVQGVRMSPEMAGKVKKTSKKLNILLTVHAPYWINLNSREKKKRENSKRYIKDAARIGFLAGARDICFHPAYYHQNEPKEVFHTVRTALKEIQRDLQKEGIDVLIRPETMGKPTQFGSLDELLDLSREIKDVEPTLDFAHLYARSNGKYNTYEDFKEILNKYNKKLGSSALKRMQIHISGMEYTEKGEKKHLNFNDKNNGFNYKACVKALKDFRVEGFLICESPNLEEDALILKELYNSL